MIASKLNLFFCFCLLLVGHPLTFSKAKSKRLTKKALKDAEENEGELGRLRSAFMQVTAQLAKLNINGTKLFKSKEKPYAVVQAKNDYKIYRKRFLNHRNPVNRKKRDLSKDNLVYPASVAVRKRLNEQNIHRKLEQELLLNRTRIATEMIVAQDEYSEQSTKGHSRKRRNAESIGSKSDLAQSILKNYVGILAASGGDPLSKTAKAAILAAAANTIKNYIANAYGGDVAENDDAGPEQDIYEEEEGEYSDEYEMEQTFS